MLRHNDTNLREMVSYIGNNISANNTALKIISKNFIKVAEVPDTLVGLSTTGNMEKLCIQCNNVWL